MFTFKFLDLPPIRTHANILTFVTKTAVTKSIRYGMSFNIFSVSFSIWTAFHFGTSFRNS